VKPTLQQITQVCSNLIGTDYEKMDCWQLAKRFYLDVFGIELKQYYEVNPRDIQKQKDLILSSKGDFIQVTSPEEGDLLVIKIHGIPAHVGVYIGEGKVLHSIQKIGVCIESFKKFNIEGIYRVKHD